MADASKLIDEYSRGASLLAEALKRAANVDMDAKPIAGKWSIREVVCHVADAEIIYADRMKRVLAEDNPTFFDADPDLFVPALHCSQRPLDQELAVVTVIRAHVLSILWSCDAKAFQRTGMHSSDGPMTLQTLLERVTAHVPHHVAFIEEKLRAMSQ